jgi:hypothetical protein
MTVPVMRFDVVIRRDTDSVELLRKAKELTKESEQKSNVGRSLYYLRDTFVDPRDAGPLLSLIRAYAPSDESRTKEQLEAEGYVEIEKYSWAGEFEDHYVELRGCTPEEWIETHPN